MRRFVRFRVGKKEGKFGKINMKVLGLGRLPGLDTQGLAASLPTLPVGLAYHERSSEHVWENEMSLLTCGEQANVVRGDDLKVRPTE